MRNLVLLQLHLLVVELQLYLLRYQLVVEDIHLLL